MTLSDQAERPDTAAVESADLQVAPVKPNHRGALRIAAERPTHIYVRRAGVVSARKAIIRDYSPYGLGLTSTCELHRDDQFLLPAMGQTLQRAQLLYTVTHARPLENGSFAIGARFAGFALGGTRRSSTNRRRWRSVRPTVVSACRRSVGVCHWGLAKIASFAAICRIGRRSDQPAHA